MNKFSITKEHKNTFLGGIFGMACCDAVGTTGECQTREAIARQPITDMVGKGRFNLLPGDFTDDTSMGLCMAESLLLHGDLLPMDHLERWHDWYMNGHLSSNGKCFDIGKTCLKNILDNLKFKREFGPLNKNQGGNGALMRLIPITLFYAYDPILAIEKSGQSSLATHHSEASIDCCKYYAGLIIGALYGATKEELLSDHYSPVPDYWKKNPLCEEVAAIAEGCYKSKNDKEISNSGYVVVAMEAALWAFFSTDSFKEGCLRISNLGDDSDTVAAIYGQLAGVFYGFDAIPEIWRSLISLKPLLNLYAEELHFHAEMASNGEKFTCTKKFKQATCVLLTLEQGYAKIMRKVDPGPNRYKSMDDFDKDIKFFKEDYVNQWGDQEIVVEMWKSFEKRLEEHDRPELERAIKLKSVGHPPIAPPVGPKSSNVELTQQVQAKETSIDDLMKSIRESSSMLKHVEKK